MISSRTRGAKAKKQAAAPPPAVDVRFFLQDQQNLDLITMILQGLLDSTKHYSFAGSYHRGDRAGTIFAGVYDINKCVQLLVQALSMVCSLWDNVVVEIAHAGAKPLFPPRALRLLKTKARLLDLKPCSEIFLRDLEEKYGDLVMDGEHRPPHPALLHPRHSCVRPWQLRAGTARRTRTRGPSFSTRSTTTSLDARKTCGTRGSNL